MSSRGPARGEVRRAQARDLDQLVVLWTEIAAHHAALDPAFALRPGLDRDVRRFLARLVKDPDAAVFVSDEAAELAGLCIVQIDHAPILLERARAEITELGVRVAFRRRGIGRRLVEVAFGWAVDRGARRVEVRVATENPLGQGFWRALGFRDFMDVLDRRL